MGNPLQQNAGLENLLNLDGEIFPMDNGYWTKFEARRVPISAQMPHGIRYSLTLHDRNNTRVLGYDNDPCRQAVAQEIRSGEDNLGPCPPDEQG